MNKKLIKLEIIGVGIILLLLVILINVLFLPSNASYYGTEDEINQLKQYTIPHEIKNNIGNVFIIDKMSNDRELGNVSFRSINGIVIGKSTIYISRESYNIERTYLHELGHLICASIDEQCADDYADSILNEQELRK